jgi:hypothetical protein
MPKVFKHWKELLKERDFLLSLLGGVALMLVAMFTNYFANSYIDSIATYPVGDLILDNIPTYNLNFFYTTGLLIITLAIIGYPLFFKPEIFPFGLKTFAAFLIIRSFFISLTHLGVPPGFFELNQPLIDAANRIEPGLFRFVYVNDLFFSGHTAAPFLAFLIFRETTFRYFFLISSFIMGATVLLMHVHYSIDVFSAYFITYTIYVVSDNIFNKLNENFRKVVKEFEKREKKLRELIKMVRKK